MEAVNEVISSNHHLMVWDIAEKVGISRTMYDEIFTDKKGMEPPGSKIWAAAFVRWTRVKVSEDLLGQATSDEKFTDSVIPADETCLRLCCGNKASVITMDRTIFTATQEGATSWVKCEGLAPNISPHKEYIYH